MIPFVGQLNFQILRSSHILTLSSSQESQVPSLFLRSMFQLILSTPSMSLGCLVGPVVPLDCLKTLLHRRTF
jgi:hypothetical protein